MIDRRTRAGALLVALLTVCAAAFARPAGAAYNYSATVLADNPEAYWRLGEGVIGQGSTLADSSAGHLHPATVANGAWGGGAAGLIAGDSNGAAGSATVYANAAEGTGNLLNITGSFSLEAWIKTTSTAQQAVIERYTGSCGYILRVESTGKLRGYVLSGTTQFAEDSVTVPTNTILHVVVTYDGSAIRLYRNGALVAGPVTSAAPCSQTSTPTRLFTRGDVPANNLQGTGDELAVYRSALSAAQVSAHYANGIDPTSSAPTTTTTAAPTTTTTVAPTTTTTVAPTTTTAPATTTTTAGPTTTTTASTSGGATVQTPADRQGGSLGGSLTGFGATLVTYLLVPALGVLVLVRFVAWAVREA